MSPYKRHMLTQLREHIETRHIALESSPRPSFPQAAPFLISAIDGTLPDGGLPRGGVHEVIPGCYADFPAALGFMTCLLHLMEPAKTTPILWCNLGRHSDFPASPYPQGLSSLGLSPETILHVSVQCEKEMLWVLEEGLSSPACPLVVGAYTAPEKLYDFTASRRLSVRAARHGGTLLLLRHHTAAGADAGHKSTAAITRWSIASRSSAAVQYSNSKISATGRPRWQVTLTRCKRGRPDSWQLEWDHETFSFRLVTPLVNGAVSPEEYDYRTGTT
ncbi:hypothetical protein NBZ79_14870 [Sneathiella marina]|uniref:Protein ImuA n=1 Tax=Sneathiella marina TaxID=2950108 RepID=A0ABY4W3I5_9PROT|nr:hypothetical protein [Sneathiella marina]USG60452.1 hypothetical protein NBZ79_14870 [Sneathiella marina]